MHCIFFVSKMLTHVVFVYHYYKFIHATNNAIVISQCVHCDQIRIHPKAFV